LRGHHMLSFAGDSTGVDGELIIQRVRGPMSFECRSSAGAKTYRPENVGFQAPKRSVVMVGSEDSRKHCRVRRDSGPRLSGQPATFNAVCAHVNLLGRIWADYKGWTLGKDCCRGARSLAGKTPSVPPKPVLFASPTPRKREVRWKKRRQRPVTRRRFNYVRLCFPRIGGKAQRV
jgi:hypothetical protein